MLTGDENILDVNMTIFWYITDLKKFLFRAADPEFTVRIAAESAVREVIAQTSMELALTKGKSEIVLQVQKLLQAIVDEYQIGIQISKVDLQKVDAPGPVIDSFRDVQSARADQERVINEATGYRDSILPKARGEAERIIQTAQAERDRLIAQSEGEAKHFLSLVKEYKLAPALTKRRMYLEKMEGIFSRMNKVLVDDRSKGVLPYLPLPGLAPHNSQKESSHAESPSN
jgi:membrane protease subunit HflK